MKLNIPKEVSALILLTLLVLIGFIIPVTLTLGNSEISNPDISFQIFLFSSLLFAGVIGTSILYYTRYLWRQDNKYGDSFGFFNIGQKVEYFKKFTGIQLTYLSILLFGSMFLIMNYLKSLGKLQNIGLTGAKVLPQQFSPSESLIFSSLLIPSAEEAMSLFVLGMLVLGLVLLCLKLKISKKEFKIYYLTALPVLMGILAVFWHMSAYSNSDIALFSVFLFWALKTLFILATGFFVVGWVFHTTNNFFIDFSRIFSNDALITFSFLVVISIAVLYFITYRKEGKWYKGAN